jgi:hypothetical protein
MMRLPDDEQNALVELTDASVEFIVIGGYAVRFHGHERIVNDLDVWIGSSPENIARLADAADRLTYHLIPATLETLQNPGEQLRFPLWNTDVLSSVNGLDFASCHDRAESADARGAIVKVLSFVDLIQSKLEAGRPKDLEDVHALTQLRLANHGDANGDRGSDY